ncbi:hypothetical protein LLH03_20865 [bacterium]|nr:hypothetical protein [bacterium]
MRFDEMKAAQRRPRITVVTDSPPVCEVEKPSIAYLQRNHPRCSCGRQAAGWVNTQAKCFELLLRGKH